MIKVSTNTLVLLAGANAGVEVESLTEVNVYASEAGSHRRGDRCFEGHAGAFDGFNNAVRNGCAQSGHNVHAGFLNVPVNFHAGGVDAHAGGFSQFRTNAVAGDQCDLMCHGARVSKGGGFVYVYSNKADRPVATQFQECLV